MDKYVPGPWQVTPDGIRIQTSETAPDYEIADCSGGGHPPSLTQCKANAHLIAASPEMLGCLKVLIKACFGAIGDDELSDIRVRAMAAIAKAEGR